MEESKSHISKDRWDTSTIIGVTILALVVVGIIFFSISSHIQNNNCKKQARASYTSEQYQAMQSLYYQQQPPPQLPFNYSTTAYNNCVSTEGLF
ncbi:MAG TPA: hypothetical protein VLF90_00225 [Patescibacteria group bacterium]|nr:hypothetical protein [Patescibacteria group bacterium]